MKIIPGGIKEYTFKGLTTKQAQKLLDKYGWWFHFEDGYECIDMEYETVTISGSPYTAHASGHNYLNTKKKKHDIVIKYNDPETLLLAKKELEKELRRK